MDVDKLIEEAKRTILEADEDKAMRLIDEVAGEDMDLMSVLNDAFTQGNKILGEEFEKGNLSLPELIYSSEVMKKVLERIMQCTDRLKKKTKGKIILATVEGDVHDIGKGIVASTLQMAGFEVIDLGREVPVEMIVEAAETYNVDIIGTSALLTSTLTEQRKLEQYLRETGLRHKYKTMVGGAPCTARWAKKIGADGYSEDAIDAVRTAEELLKHER